MPGFGCRRSEQICVVYFYRLLLYGATFLGLRPHLKSACWKDLSAMILAICQASVSWCVVREEEWCRRWLSWVLTVLVCLALFFSVIFLARTVNCISVQCNKPWFLMIKILPLNGGKFSSVTPEIKEGVGINCKMIFLLIVKLKSNLLK